MVLFILSHQKYGRLFYWGLLILVAAYTPLVIGQQVGVSLKLFGATIPNNSLVDLDDILYRAPHPCCNVNPSNDRPDLHDGTLLCVTDLVDCCDTPHTVQGDWFYPDGSVVPFGEDGGPPTFRSNRGPNEVVDGRQFYGSVRLFHRWSNPLEKGRYRCELPSAANPNVTLTLYAYILDFGNRTATPVILSPSGPGIAGNTFSLTCSATLTLYAFLRLIPLPTNVPPPTFEWFFGPQGDASLPSGVTPTATAIVWMIGRTYTSTLQFSPVLNESHAGNYTCRLGAGRLASSMVVSVEDVTIQIATSGSPIVVGQDLVLKQNNYTLTCNVTVAEHLCPYTTTYQWTKHNSTVTQLQVGADHESNTLSFSPLRLSDAGQYTCQATVHSFRKNYDITVMESQNVRIQIPAPTSVMCKSATPNPVHPIRSTVNLTCIVNMELDPAVDVPVILTTQWTGPDGFTTTNISQPILLENSFTYTNRAEVISLGRDQSGIYKCVAVLNASSSTDPYFINSNPTSNSIQVTTGAYLTLRNRFIANNTQINIRSIGLSSDTPNGALQCITDKNPCCFSSNHRHGEWYLPNRMLVLNEMNQSNVGFYRNRGDNGRVYLNRFTNNNISLSPTGRFCCEVPDMTDTNQILCVFIDRISLTGHGSLIAGESYTLQCSAGESQKIKLFEWLWESPDIDGRTPVANSSFLTITSNSSSESSQLEFRPLKQANNGSYFCRATAGEATLISQPIEVRAKDPSISIQIIEYARGIAGERLDLTCRMLGAENLNPSVTYRWTKSSSSSHIQVESNSNTLSFTPVRLSDAGNYSCMVTITSSYLTSNITTMVSQSVMVQIPPSSITLTSDVANPLEIVGSDILLTCTVELNSAILNSEIFLVRINAQLLRDGTELAIIGPRVSDTAITYTAQLNSFGRSDFGNYTCTATLSPQPSSTYLTGIDALFDCLTIKAVIPPPVDVWATQSSFSAPVEVSWSPPTDQGPFNITGYEIFYGNGQNVSVPKDASSIGLRVKGGFDGQTVFLRSESNKLYSELVNVTVESDRSHFMAKCSCSCSRELGAIVGVMMSLVVITIVAVIVVLCCWWRKKSVARDIAVSANAAYKDVTWKAEETEFEREYQNVDMIRKSSQQQPDNDIIAAGHGFYIADKSSVSEYTSTTM